MQTIKNATIIGRTRGDNNLVILSNQENGETLRLINVNNLEIETGFEGIVEFDVLSNQLISFEMVMAEEIA
jgi:hypothetical protein